MDYLNWMYVALLAGGFVIGFLVGNSIATATLKRMLSNAFEKGVVIGYSMAEESNPAHPIEEHEEELTK